jgi:signal transduction histidine kinase
VTALGWIVAAGLALRTAILARRLKLVARAEHELRGPLGALGLVAAAAAREPHAGRLAAAIESQLERARAGLADLAAAQQGRSAPARPELVPLQSAAADAARAIGPVRLDWRAGPVAVRADRGRLAQILGNLLQNAFEHGGGDVSLRARRRQGRVLVEVADRGPGFARSRPRAARRRPRRGRGHGLGIAARAAEEAGGRLRLIEGGRGATVAVELPVAER